MSAIRDGERRAAHRIPGIGKKTAERIGLELKDKMASFLPAESAAVAAAAASETLRTDVLSALMNLGYHRPLAERAVEAAIKKSTDGQLRRHVLKHALRELSRSSADHVLQPECCMRALFRAVILVTFGVVGRARRACASRARTTGRISSPSCGSAGRLAARDLFHGPAAQIGAPAGRRIHMGGYGYDRIQSRLRCSRPDGRMWNVKLGPEAQSEVVASRVLWAIGYHQPATYYVSNWQLSGGPGGAQQGARFRLEPKEAEVVGDWSWGENEFTARSRTAG